MDKVTKSERLPGLAVITPDFVKNWKVEHHHQQAPFLLAIICAVAQTDRAVKENKRKTPDTLCNVIMKQLAYQRSNRSLGFPSQIGLYLWSSGSSRQTIDAIHRCGLSMCYTSVLTVVKVLGDHSMKAARMIAKVPRILGYDNINLSTSIFVEQRGSATPAKVSSGTFAILYPIPGADPKDFEIQPIIANFCTLGPEALKFERNIRPSPTHAQIVQSNFIICIVHVLIQYNKSLHHHYYKPEFQPIVRRQTALEPHSTQQYPTEVLMNEEASAEGNILFQDELYTDKLQRTSEEMSGTAIGCVGDQLTNSCNRTIKEYRAQDVNSWENRDVIQPGMGNFHLNLNFSWMVLHTHHGSLNQTSSLTYFFKVIDKTRLGGENPDYHTLTVVFTQIFDGVILSYWCLVCGDLDKYLKSSPSQDDMFAKAQQILFKHLTPLPESPASQLNGLMKASLLETHEAVDSKPKDSKSKKSPPVTLPLKIPAGPDAAPSADIVNRNLCLLTRDLLVMTELMSAMEDGDVGRVEDLYPYLAMMFRGAGGTNYSTEILWLTLNLKYVWTLKFADVMRDFSLINTHGSPIPVDLNAEFAIGKLKRLIVAKGHDSTWDNLGHASAAINSLEDVKSSVAGESNLSYQN
ncbi:hypothetical protein H1R20_g904, partial [Candolleomyces eurysporus]